jgi:hypothetical protein
LVGRADGNTALILAVRSTMSEYQRVGSSDCPEIALGEEVVEYLLCHGADPYRRDHAGQTAFDYLFAATAPKHPVRRKFLRLLNLARVAWDAASGAVWLLRPAGDPRRPGRLLVLRPGQHDLWREGHDARAAAALARKQARAKAEAAARKDSVREARRSGSQGSSQGSSQDAGGSVASRGSLDVDSDDDNDDDDDFPLLPASTSCAHCGYSKLLLVEVLGRHIFIIGTFE